MLSRISFTLLFFCSFLFAEIKIFATKTYDENNTVVLIKPLIIYDDIIIQAQRGEVTDKRKIVLKDKVVLSKKGSVLYASSLVAYSSKNIEIGDIFYYDNVMQGWVKAKKARSKENIIKFDKLYFSTCCVNSPDWYIKSSGAVYNKDKKDLKLFNVRLVLGEVPILYSPYMYLNFDKTRRSGFLRPYIGYSQNEGVLYSQPIYIVTSVNSDLEITPTIRTLRGRGVYSVFRFIDSENSSGVIKAGIFNDDKSFYLKNNLANKSHYGYTVKYERTNIAFDDDALYLNLKYANDVDYFYLDAYNYRFNDIYLSDKIITSEMNYIHPTKNTLYGAYFKYFIDTSLKSNDTTWQILPQLNLHRFLTKNNGLLNSYDINFYNYYRKSGSNFLLADILVPVSYYKSLLNDYLKFKITEQFSGGYGFYYQENSPKSEYFTLSTQIKLYTSLTKFNNEYIHIISPSLTLNLKNYAHSKIYSDLINIPDVQNYLTFNLFEIFQNDMFNLTHTLNETYYLDLEKFADLENIFTLKFSNYTIDENNRYSIEKNFGAYNNFKISYNNKKYLIYVSHVYQKDVSESIISGLKYNINDYKKIYTEYGYDIRNDFTKYWLLGVNLNKKCFKYDFSFKQSHIPVLEENGISYRKDNLITINVEFVPIGGINQAFVFKGNK